MSVEIKDFDGAYRRLLEASGISNQTELARILGISKAGVSHSLKRKKLPLDWVLKLNYLMGVNPKYIIDGTGEKTVKSRVEQDPIPPKEQSVQDRLKEKHGVAYLTISQVEQTLDEYGKMKPSEKAPFYIPFRYASQLGISDGHGEQVKAMRIAQDMAEDLKANDVVFLNTEETSIMPEKIYAWPTEIGYIFYRKVRFNGSGFEDSQGQSIPPDAKPIGQVMGTFRFFS